MAQATLSCRFAAIHLEGRWNLPKAKDGGIVNCGICSRSSLTIPHRLSAEPPLHKGALGACKIRGKSRQECAQAADAADSHRRPRRLGQALHRTLHKQQAVQFACCGAGYLRACVALKPSGGAGLSKGQRGNIRKFPLAPWKTTPLVAVSYSTKLNGCRGFDICQMNTSCPLLTVRHGKNSMAKTGAFLAKTSSAARLFRRSLLLYYSE